VHGDPNCKNFGFERSPRPKLLLLDWQIVTRAPPAVDLAYVLALFSAVLPVSYEEVIDRYRACLAARLGDRFDERWWRPQLDLALLGHFLRFGGLLTWRMTRHPDPEVREHYRMVLDWWTERALAGARWL
jgi:ecdysteroid kinase